MYQKEATEASGLGCIDKNVLVSFISKFVSSTYIHQLMNASSGSYMGDIFPGKFFLGVFPGEQLSGEQLSVLYKSKKKIRASCISFFLH